MARERWRGGGEDMEGEMGGREMGRGARERVCKTRQFYVRYGSVLPATVIDCAACSGLVTITTLADRNILASDRKSPRAGSQEHKGHSGLATQCGDSRCCERDAGLRGSDCQVCHGRNARGF